MTHVAQSSKLREAIPVQDPRWLSDMRSCIMPWLPTHLVQELNVGTVYFYPAGVGPPYPPHHALTHRPGGTVIPRSRKGHWQDAIDATTALLGKLNLTFLLCMRSIDKGQNCFPSHHLF